LDLIVQTKNGWFSQKVLMEVISLYPDYDGWLYISDDVMINPPVLDNHDITKLWNQGSNHADGKEFS
jgi:hypothetical protein